MHSLAVGFGGVSVVFKRLSSMCVDEMPSVNKHPPPRILIWNATSPRVLVRSLMRTRDDVFHAGISFEVDGTMWVVWFGMYGVQLLTAEAEEDSFQYCKVREDKCFDVDVTDKATLSDFRIALQDTVQLYGDLDYNARSCNCVSFVGHVLRKLGQDDHPKWLSVKDQLTNLVKNASPEAQAGVKRLLDWVEGGFDAMNSVNRGIKRVCQAVGGRM